MGMMELVIIIVIVVILFALGRRFFGLTRVDPAAIDWNAANEGQIQAWLQEYIANPRDLAPLIKAGQRYIELTGVPGKEASAVMQHLSQQVQRQPPATDWNAANDPEVQDYIQRGQKINAIKRYRELTNMGLKEAKDAIDYLIDNPQAAGDKKKAPALTLQGEGVRDLVKAGRIDEAVDVYAKFAGVDVFTAKDAIATMQRDLDNPVNAKQRLADTLNPQVAALIEQGNKIEAIKLYRELTGLGLKEAKDAIEQAQREMRR